MNRTTYFIIFSLIVVVSLLNGLRQGTVPEAVGGWVLETQVRWQRKGKWRWRIGRRVSAGRKADAWRMRLKNWHIPFIRSLLLWGLWEVNGKVGSDWWQLLPWLIWILPAESRKWNWIRRGLWEIQRVVIIGYAGLSVYQVLRMVLSQMGVGSYVWLGCVLGGAEETPLVSIERTEEGKWQATISGHFTLQVSDDHPFRLRLLLIFLGLLQSENDERRSRRTRDGRTPFVRQEQLASWTNTKQENISRWMKYWLNGDWANLLSLKTAEVLTAELVERIVTVFASFPQWTSTEVHQYLRKEGCQVSEAQIAQASQTSGWSTLKATLAERFDFQTGLHLRDKWLVSQLLQQIQALLVKVESGTGQTPEIQTPLRDLQTIATQAGAVATPPLPVQPWMQTLEGQLLGNWEQVTDPDIRCTYCGSADTAPKSSKPRIKKFYNAQGQIQEVEVCRYYCHNPLCTKKSFTHFPAGLLPYSPYRTQVHVLALQMYAWGYSTYRRTGTALGVYSMTAWRWLQAWGYALLPVATLFGIVRCSGTVGIDEKYVLVPKNDKPAGKMRRWMYVYLAVDAYTYDLLHIAIFPNDNSDSAKAFLFALRAKGYHPSVIVTDLRQDYGACISLVFPNAIHHECIFHALQNAQKHIKDVYGPRYRDLPNAMLLKQQIYAIFDTLSPSEATSRFQQVLALKDAYVLDNPDALVVFDFLLLHWPKLVNGIGSDTVPTTNNVTELVIRRFDQHYQNFCGFDSIQSAQAYLAIFEKLYRFTPFSDDAQPRIRGKSPLQLAGYDVSNIPWSSICSGLSIDWPTELNFVPN